MPWAPHQQMRFASSDEKFKDHYKTLGVKPSDSPKTIADAWTEKVKATHSDHNKGINKDEFIEVSSTPFCFPPPLPCISKP